MIIDENEFFHYGVIRRSGRYPWGSGKDENTHNKILLDYISEMKAKGLSEKERAEGLGMTIKELRAEKSNAVAQQKQAKIATVEGLTAKGYSPTGIEKRTGIPESTVRSLLVPGARDRADRTQTTAKVLKEQVDVDRFVDVGSGTENHIGVTRTTLDTAIQSLKTKGYELHKLNQPQVAGKGKFTKMVVLGAPGTKQREIFLDPTLIQTFGMHTEDGGHTYIGKHNPIEINPKRVDVVYGPQGGDKADGMIYVRPGVKDVELGGSKYAQVRVAVGKDHFLKGMAIYKDGLPEGIDLQFHTNKESTGDKLDAMKKNSSEVPDPSGKHVLLKSVKRQIVENGGTPKERVTSAMNIVNEEGNWKDWSINLSSQMLSKQSPELAKNQLDMTYERRKNEFDSINGLTNATVRKKLLKHFADSTDSASIHLKAAGLPRTGSHVILPVPSLPPHQVYAPNYKNGESVVLIRHPHAGPFEIPELTVNNNHAASKKLLGTKARDAIGINHEVAQKLSGADFDGDTVLVIPNRDRQVKTKPILEELRNFNPRAAYPGYEGMKVMSNTQNEMGVISNLITDMSLKMAPMDHMVRAVKHSMVVIDAEKHKLDYKLSASDNGIKELKQKYQEGGASTLISRAKSSRFIPQRKERTRPLGGPIDPKTGEKKFEVTGVKNKKGGFKLSEVPALALESDAHALSSGTPMEHIYAVHSNKLKALANEARRVDVNTPNPKQSPTARKAYADQVKTLNASLDLALRARPLERRAQILASAVVRARTDANPGMEAETRKKIESRALEEARLRTGAKRYEIKISDEEWNAIQAGAISHSKLDQILDRADMKIVREHATPKNKILMTSAKTKRAQDMLDLGFTRSQVADQLGVSLSTLDKSIDGG